MSSDKSIQVIEIPKWGLSMEEGAVIQWLIAEGDSFAEGDLIAEIESSKIVNELEAPFAGTLRKILAEVDEILPVGAPIALVADADVSDVAVADFLAAAEADTKTPQSMPDAPVAAAATVQATDRPVVAHTSETGTRIPAELQSEEDDAGAHATLHARRLATELGVNLNCISGTGRNKRISRQDVINAVTAAGGSVEATAPRAQTGRSESPRDAAGPGSPATSISLGDLDPSLATDIPMDSMRRAISSRVTMSKSFAPHFRVVIDAEIDQLLAARAERNAADLEHKVSVTDYLVKATAMALLEVPECNIQFDGNTIRRFKDAHISVAVALDNGLISPIVNNASKKSVSEISQDIVGLVGKAKAGSLTTAEFEGGTFTISNLGAYGVKQFDAIINSPQGAILAVGRAEKRYVEHDGKPALATVLTLTLSADHRVIDGAVAAKLLRSLKGILENPARME